ncbi:hypothetical protein GCM10010358_80660 [Streptomyces minutiscleroticus]|uniref:Uncharacterized protein n=1 Tax=Streptomyces minutiscleroticus TaxID=68238 RepID=A0A918P2X0_9ACTN|nr:hypothetical protein [Streptomyces minutiscleroticus]GGY16931.1 hypothetical protein GCM10010358_80660 [Streptomyces minutiscleroticus]
MPVPLDAEAGRVSVLATTEQALFFLGRALVEDVPPLRVNAVVPTSAGGADDGAAVEHLVGQILGVPDRKKWSGMAVTAGRARRV